MFEECLVLIIDGISRGFDFFLNVTIDGFPLLGFIFGNIIVGALITGLLNVVKVGRVSSSRFGRHKE